MNILQLQEIDSTNDYLKQLLQQNSDLPEGFVVSADFQTAGKGQVGNSWESKRGENLLFSILLKPNGLEASQQFLISRYVALAIIAALHQFIGPEVMIKWPNDIYFQNKKLAGVLIENTTQGKFITTSIVGIGLNVNQSQFDSEASNPISMSQIAHHTFDKDVVMHEIEQSLWHWKNKDAELIEQTYMQHLYRANGNFYTYESEGMLFQAKIKDVLSNGRLLLECEDSTLREFAIKEVKFVL